MLQVVRIMDLVDWKDVLIRRHAILELAPLNYSVPHSIILFEKCSITTFAELEGSFLQQPVTCSYSELY
jgi:hypothetical protein